MRRDWAALRVHERGRANSPAPVFSDQKMRFGTSAGAASSP